MKFFSPKTVYHKITQYAILFSKFFKKNYVLRIDNRIILWYYIPVNYMKRNFRQFIPEKGLTNLMNYNKVIINTDLLNQYMLASHTDIKKLSKTLGFSIKKTENILNNTNAEALTYKDINSIVETLKIPVRDAVNIFFGL